MDIRRLAALVLAGTCVLCVCAQNEAPDREPVAVAGSDSISQQPWYGPGLPRWREGGTPWNPKLDIGPRAIDLRDARDEPTAGLITAAPEYEPVRGVLFQYKRGHFNSTVTDCVVALTAGPTYDEIAYVVVSSASDESHATNAFVAGGADMSKVEFINVAGTNSVWMRDFGPHFQWQDGTMVVGDSHYYPGRAQDNFVPTLVGDDYFGVPTYDVPVYFSGGNFLPGPDRTAFVTSLIREDNPAAGGFDDTFLGELHQRYLGIDTLHILDRLPASVDGTGHIDMWLYIVDEDNVIVSEFLPGSNATAIARTDAGAAYMESLGYTVHRPPAWNALVSGYNSHLTYANAFRVNDRIFIPSYGLGNFAYMDEDAEAVAAWEAAAGPGVEIVPINCYDIIWAAGAIHCIVKQVPRYTGSTPAVCVLSPQPDDLLVAGTEEVIRWVATDTDNVAIPVVDLYYSTDVKAWTHIATTSNSGEYAWTVPDTAAPNVSIRVVATSADTDQGEATMAGPCAIVRADQSTYDFSSAAGTSHFGWGGSTVAWTLVGANSQPVAVALTADEYLRASASDATGGYSDVNRLISSTPSSSYESTYVFEFTLAEYPEDIDEISVLWEGLAYDCAQVELYAWNQVTGAWGDGGGLTGQNRFFDNWAGNVDGELTGVVRANVDNFLDVNGRLRLLLYAERGGDRTYHDYVAVEVTTITQTLAGDVNCDGVVDFGDINAFVAVLTDLPLWQAWYPDCHLLNADTDGNGSAGFEDINPFVALLIQG